jgi:hypothetical protein
MSGSTYLTGAESNREGLGFTSTSGTFTSRAAERLKPPVEAAGASGCGGLLLFAAVWIIPSLLLSATGLPWPLLIAAWIIMCLVGCVVSAPVFNKAKAVAAKAYEAKRKVYDRLWYCLQCGELADVDAFRPEFHATQTPDRTQANGGGRDAEPWFQD